MATRAQQKETRQQKANALQAAIDKRISEFDSGKDLYAQLVYAFDGGFGTCDPAQLKIWTNDNYLSDTCGTANNPTILGFYISKFGDGLQHIELAPGTAKSWEKRSGEALMFVVSERAMQYQDVVRADDSVVVKAEPQFEGHMPIEAANA